MCARSKQVIPRLLQRIYDLEFEIGEIRVVACVESTTGKGLEFKNSSGYACSCLFYEIRNHQGFEQFTWVRCC